MFFNKNNKELVQSEMRFFKRKKDLNELENKVEIQNEENEDRYSQIDFYKIYKLKIGKCNHDDPLIFNIDNNIKIKVYKTLISLFGDTMLVEIYVNQILLSIHDIIIKYDEKWEMYYQETRHKMPKEVVESINNWLTKTVKECEEKKKQEQIQREKRAIEREREKRERHDQEEIILEQVYKQYRKDN